VKKHALGSVAAALILCHLFAADPCLGAESPAGSVSTARLYCNVFIGSACFAISAGDRVTMAIPADYVMYDLTLNAGLHGFVYNGLHPDSSPYEKALPCKAANKDDQCHYISDDKSVRVLYIASGDDGYAIDLTLDGINPSNRADASKFLRHFRRCQEAGLGVRCGDKVLFDIPGL
jgi:hypothetical protein